MQQSLHQIANLKIPFILPEILCTVLSNAKLSIESYQRGNDKGSHLYTKRVQRTEASMLLLSPRLVGMRQSQE